MIVTAEMLPSIKIIFHLKRYLYFLSASIPAKIKTDKRLLYVLYLLIKLSKLKKQLIFEPIEACKKYSDEGKAAKLNIYTLIFIQKTKLAF
jgi:hypothetical protein